ncbi:MAG: pyrroline-5-carboxylate reductase [Bacteroidaceae bacterium]|nr:pyrroline-5-carboxylate reductase [Bacteroidaceae bacterium]
MKIAIIGAGNMGSAIARGLVRTAQGIDVIVSNPSAGKLDTLKKEFPQIEITTDNGMAVKGADFVFLAVKPWKMEEVIAEIKPALNYNKQVIVSVAGGVGSESLDGWLVKEGGLLPQLYIVIPNTAIATLCGMTFISGKRTVQSSDVYLTSLFDAMGKAMMVPEKLIPAGTSLASCGIAYALQYINASMQGGSELGFSHSQALEIVMQTMRGALSVLEAGGAEPQTEIDRVTTPGGLTLRGLEAMREGGFSQSIIEGLHASIKK